MIVGAVIHLVLIVLALMGKRWAYIIFVGNGLLQIPLRTGFQLEAPECALSLSMAGARSALINYPHIMLFAVFFVITYAQFPPSRRALLWAGVATIVFGAVIELEQGATRTGNCELHDLIPDAIGAFVASVLVLSWQRLRHRWQRTRSTLS